MDHNHAAHPRAFRQQKWRVGAEAFRFGGAGGPVDPSSSLLVVANEHLGPEADGVLLGLLFVGGVGHIHCWRGPMVRLLSCKQAIVGSP